MSQETKQTVIQLLQDKVFDYAFNTSGGETLSSIFKNAKFDNKQHMIDFVVRCFANDEFFDLDRSDKRYLENVEMYARHEFEAVFGGELS